MERQRKGCRKHNNKQSQSCRESSIHRFARLPQIVDATYWFLLTSGGWTTQRTAMIWKLSNVYAIQKNPLRQDIHRLTRRVHRLALHTLTIRHWHTPYPYGLPLRILSSFASVSVRSWYLIFYSCSRSLPRPLTMSVRQLTGDGVEWLSNSPEKSDWNQFPLSSACPVSAYRSL